MGSSAADILSAMVSAIFPRRRIWLCKLTSWNCEGIPNFWQVTGETEKKWAGQCATWIFQLSSSWSIIVNRAALLSSVFCQRSRRLVACFSAVLTIGTLLWRGVEKNSRDSAPRGRIGMMMADRKKTLKNWGKINTRYKTSFWWLLWDQIQILSRFSYGFQWVLDVLHSDPNWAFEWI